MKTSPDTRATAFRAIRSQLGLSRAALAGKLGISPDYVKLMEHGIRPISTRTFMAIEHLTCKANIGLQCAECGFWFYKDGNGKFLEGHNIGCKFNT
jgi:transcriptional regulator with XRE-family HTH domain